MLTIWAVWRNSPCRGLLSISRGLVWERSPFATARMTLAVSAVGWTKSVMRVLIELIPPIQAPLAPERAARWLILPSLPTTTLMRSNSVTIPSFISIMSLRVSAILPAIPVFVTGILALKLPFLTATRVCSNWFKSNSSGFSVCAVAIV